MKNYFLIIFLTLLATMKSEEKMIYDFHTNSSFQNWAVVDDGVMGGLSSGNLGIKEDGNGLFYGYVSLDNYGGFTSVRFRKNISLKGYDKVVLRILGDNKFYQLRIKSGYRDRHSYVKTFYAADEWSDIEISLSSMEPQFRGRSLNMRNFSGNSLVELGLLIGNKVEERFALEIDHIRLK
tara:strand:- start:2063 stop:2602 length:540 start_codon:yes stop_codon:yes gene_type:complete